MSEVLAKGLSRDFVEELSRRKDEPEWLRQQRLRAWDVFNRLEAPLGNRGDLGTLRTMANFKFQNLTPYIPASDGVFTPAIEQALRDAPVADRSGLIVQRNSSVVRVELDDELKRQGVILCSLETAAREHAELVRQYFMTTCVPVESNKYTAMHAAFWSGGVFLYVPRGVEIEQPILAHF